MLDFLGRSLVEFRMDEAEMKELMECSVSMVVFVDMARLVSKVEWLGEEELDMEELVEVMAEVSVGTVDWAMCPEGRVDFDALICSACRLPTAAWKTEVETEGVTCSVNARSLLA